ncbi:MAG: LPS assembly lipoprotein LptE [Cyclobacteriaceae bacterium]|nr:LPS assembly lipoprotein LptE [Cyclobacteriaceae bacterium]
MIYKNRIYILLILLSIIFLKGCGIYSFTGVSTDAETITINSFFHEADAGPPDLGQRFTDEIRDYFQQNTSLEMVEEEGQLFFEGAVTDWRLTPVSAQASRNPDDINTAAQTRLTITVSVNFADVNHPENDFSRTFSFYSDFDNEVSVSEVEDDLIEEIFEQIILNIFNASVANW